MAVLLTMSLGVAHAVAASWSATGSMTTPRGDFGHEPTATLLSDGRVLLAGGVSDGSSLTSTSAELYDPATGTWSATGSMGVERIYHAAVLLSGPGCGANCGKVLVAGGSFFAPDNASAELYDPATGTWRATASMSSGHIYVGQAAVLLPDGKVLVGGGSGSGGAAELYDPVTETWSSAGTMNRYRTNHQLILLKTGKVLAVGGAADATAELYDPATKTWTFTGPMTLTRRAHTATLLPDGKVLVAGGVDPDTSLSVGSAELYDPATNSWSKAPWVGQARSEHTATSLADGKVLVAGGLNRRLPGCCPLNSAMIYDSATGRWRPTATMTTSRAFHSALRLVNGKVLAAGGISFETGRTASSELYTP